MGKKLTSAQFIERAVSVHGDKYDYSKVEYVGGDINVVIVCPEHGEFKQRPDNHLSGKGCSKCGKKTSFLKAVSTTSKFISKAKLVHGDKYDYSKVEYNGSSTIVSIICSEHGEFKQRPDVHLMKGGCMLCRNKKLANNRKDSLDVFIHKAKLVHGDKYDYSEVVYVNQMTKVKIICPKHGMNEQLPNAHLKGHGCRICCESKGEKKIKNWLDINNIDYIQEHKFNDCKNIKLLAFDFFLPLQKICIEYDGEQHFKSISHFGGDKTLHLTQKRDNIKTKYCHDKSLKLIRIKFNDNIEHKLKTNIQNKKG